MMPKWLRRKVTQWSDSIEAADASRREVKLWREHDQLQGMFTRATARCELLCQERDDARRQLKAANAALAVEQRAHYTTNQRLVQLIEADKKRNGEMQVIENACDQTDFYATELRTERDRLREQVKSLTAERDRARMVQTAGYDLDDTADEKRYADVVGETP